MICPNCSQFVSDGSRFCTNCGTKLLDSVIQEDQQAGGFQATAPEQQAGEFQQAAPEQPTDGFQTTAPEQQTGGFQATPGYTGGQTYGEFQQASPVGETVVKKGVSKPVIFGIIGGGVFLLAAVITLIIVFIVMGGKTKYNLQDYTTVEFSGVEGSGKADVSIDAGELAKAIAKNNGMDADKYSKENIDFDLDCIKSIMFQILSGVKYIHDNYILHRDIKPANILIKNKGEVKLADFGLSRFFEKRKNHWKAYSNNVVTLWYRAPELLLSECYYKTSIDMWSVGCVMAELFTKQPLFKEQNPLNQIKAIFNFIGRPKEEELMRYYKINEGSIDFPKNLESIMPESGEVVELDKKLIEMDKTKYLKDCEPALNLITG